MALLHEKLTRSVIGAFYEVFNTLGFGFPEATYADALVHELILRGHKVECEVDVTPYYKGVELRHLRLDIVVDGKLVLELKACEKLHQDAPRQLLGYLKATTLEVGLLLHFGPERANFFRVVCSNNKKPSAQSANPRDVSSSVAVRGPNESGK